jgi:two-component system, chemotaxis family, chemotaxis protein CheY
MEMSLGTRLLVVDDDPTIREMLEMLLDSEGYEVATASNGADALDALPELHPDLIILDMKMPVMDGWEFMDRYRTLPDATAPVVVLSAAQDTGRRAAEVGAQAYVSKPFAIDDLLKVVEQTAAA